MLTNHPNVRPELRARVLAAVAEVGYEPDLLASALRRGKTRTVGVLVSDVVNPTIAAMVDTLETEFRAAGYGVLLSNSRGDPARDIEGVTLLRQRRVDGLVLAVADDTDAAVAETLGRLAVPVVLMDRHLDNATMSRVLSDHYGGIRALFEHLIAQGHRRIAMVNGPTLVYPTRERLRAATAVLDEHGLDPSDLGRRGPATQRFGVDVAAEMLAGPKPPTALVVGNANTLVGVLGELTHRGVRVGDDLAVAAGDHSFITGLHTPRITTLTRDLAEVGRHAAQLLIAHMADPARAAHTIVLPTGLQVGGSTTLAVAAAG